MGNNFNSDNKRKYEDISSSSHSTGGNDIPFSQLKNKHLSPKRRKKECWWNKLSKGKKALTIVLSVVVLLSGLIIVNPFHMIEHILYNYNHITEKEEELGFEGKIDKKIINIALFGIDTRNKKTFKGNSDSIMILSLNTELKTVKIVSVMRDTIVPIKEDGKRVRYSKINAAYAKSPELAIKTLNECFGLDISEYATVNFYGMSEIIDAVGGIDATVTEDELKWKGKDHPNLNNCMDEICANLKLDASKYYIKSAGKQHMNGIQAVAYSRVRNCKSIWGTNNDYGRTDRQRYVMEQLFNKAITLEKSKYATLAKALIPCTETSLSYKQVLGLAFDILLDHPTFYQARLPQDDWQMPFRWSGYGSVVYYDLDFASKALHSLFYEGVTIEEYVEQNGVGKNDWFASLGKTKASSGSTGKTVTSSTTSQGNTSSAVPSNTSSEEPTASSSETENSNNSEQTETPSEQSTGNTSTESTVEENG